MQRRKGNFYYNPGANYFEDSSGVRIFYDGENNINYDIQIVNEEQEIIPRYDICGNRVQYTNNYYNNTTKELLYGYRINKKEYRKAIITCSITENEKKKKSKCRKTTKNSSTIEIDLCSVRLSDGVSLLLSSIQIIMGC